MSGLDKQLLNADWRFLEEFVEYLRALWEPFQAYRFKAVYTQWTGRTDEKDKLFRNFLECEYVISRLLQICCPTCHLIIPFKRPWDENNELIEWQLRRDLFEIEAAVRQIETCEEDLDRHYIARVFRVPPGSMLTGMTIMQIRLSDGEILDTGFGFPSLASANYTNGSWDRSQRRFVGYAGGQTDPAHNGVFIFHTEGDDVAAWTKEYNVFPLVGTFRGGLGFVPRQGELIAYRTDPGGGVGDSMILREGNPPYAHISTISIGDIRPGSSGDILAFSFSNNGQWVAFLTTNDSGIDEVVVYERGTGVAVFRENVTASQIGFSDDSDYFWYRAGTIKVFETTGWTQVASGAPSPIPFILGGRPPDSDYIWVGTAASFFDNTSEQDFYDFDFNLLHQDTQGSTALGTAIGYADFTSDGEWFVAAGDNLSPNTDMRSVRMSDFSSNIAGTQGTYSIRIRPFYNPT